MKKITKKWDLEISNVETELKIGIYAKNWAKQVMLKNCDYGQSQRSTVKVNGHSQRSTADVCWRGRKRSSSRHVSESGLARGGRVAGTDGAWWRVLVRQKLQPARGGACDAVSGRSWLGFARDWLFCLSMPVLWQLNAQNVDIWVLQYCGRDGGGSLLTVTTGWRRGQRKNAGDVHRNQKVRGMALILC